ncbi:hypothetical protein BXZ70DRAFT_910757 [Cristinia sonorae]|uniref:Uncharacterized protein n=1 Tax=Cristinia sonorae TaxID=1940300 RepID=A0A8K0UH01_9AGAR|nr:hypothetical protein BXZ70DRAFT_910757 [Cristinia sonorae]
MATLFTLFLLTPIVVAEGVPSLSFTTPTPSDSAILVPAPSPLPFPHVPETRLDSELESLKVNNDAGGKQAPDAGSDGARTPGLPFLYHRPTATATPDWHSSWWRVHKSPQTFWEAQGAQVSREETSATVDDDREEAISVIAKDDGGQKLTRRDSEGIDDSDGEGLQRRGIDLSRFILSDKFDSAQEDLYDLQVPYPEQSDSGSITMLESKVTPSRAIKIFVIRDDQLTGYAEFYMKVSLLTTETLLLIAGVIADYTPIPSTTSVNAFDAMVSVPAPSPIPFPYIPDVCIELEFEDDGSRGSADDAEGEEDTKDPEVGLPELPFLYHRPTDTDAPDWFFPWWGVYKTPQVLREAQSSYRSETAASRTVNTDEKGAPDGPAVEQVPFHEATPFVVLDPNLDGNHEERRALCEGGKC